MQKSRHFRAFWLCKSGVALVLVVCLIAFVAYFASAHSEETNLPALDFESMDAIEQQAWQLAEEIVGSSRDAQERFVTELLNTYYSVRNSDFAIFCNPGGWGNEPLSANYQGQSYLAGMEAELTELGYRYCIVDDVRTGSGLWSYLFELKEYLTHYPSKAKELAVKIDFLTQQVTGLKVIITGQSNGAAFTSEVAKYLENNPKIYSIQVGCPFWYQAPEVGQSLVINDSGIGVDTLAKRDLMTLLKVNCVKLFVIGHAPSFTPVDWMITRAVLVFGSYDFNLGLKAPGHEYIWEYPGVGPVIEAFLADNFGIE